MEARLGRGVCHVLTDTRLLSHYVQQRARLASDRILKNQIQKINEGKVMTTDCKPSRRCQLMKQYRRRHPNFLPGWAEQKWLERQAERHHSLIKKADTCVDSHLGERLSFINCSCAPLSRVRFPLSQGLSTPCSKSSGTRTAGRYPP
jgi:hypothetical protein